MQGQARQVLSKLSAGMKGAASGCRRLSSERPPGLAHVDGRWVGAASGKLFSVLNPADGATVVEKVPDMDATDAIRAIDAASAAFPAYRRQTGRERAKLLGEWHRLLEIHAEELACLMTSESGKTLNEARAEVRYGNSFVAWYAEEASRVNGELLASSQPNRELLLLREPLGVAALITPWNFPHAMITRKAGAALAAGCTCVIKPSEETPLTALELARLGELAGLPPGSINVITTSRENSLAVGRALCDDPRVRALSFTGSTSVGKQLYAQCAPTMKRLSLELGGNAPFIVFDTADLGLAVAGAMASKFRNCGQTCISANRFYVHARHYEAFLAELVGRVRDDVKLGPGDRPDVSHGPLINARQLGTVSDLVRDARAKGAHVRCGGEPLPKLGPNFYAPTVLTGVTSDMDIYWREIFGPVAVVHCFEEEREVLERANELPVGLAGYFYSSDLSQIFRVARALEVGMVGVNEGIISCAEAAFGGVKDSGIGREGSSHGINEYLDVKYVCLGNIRY